MRVRGLRQRFFSRPLAAALLLLAAVALPAPWAAYAQEHEDEGWALFLDNDAFTLGTTDHDYTAGLAVTFAGSRVPRWPLSLDPALAAVNARLGIDARDASEWHALQLSVLAFTPAQLEATAPLAGDRPYASIVYVANSRTTVPTDSAVAFQTSLAVGALGLDIAKASQRRLHAALGSDEPRGWRHQVGEGGELTARYTLAQLRQLAAGGLPGATFQLKGTVAASVGYLTDVSAALTLRGGRLHTPWWSFVPERAEYMTEPAPVYGGRARSAAAREVYAWAGVKVRARAYNALLQGQFRDSVLSYDFDDLRPLIGEAWAGVTRELDAGYRVSWLLRWQTSELRTRPGDRELLWAGVSVSRSF